MKAVLFLRKSVFAWAVLSFGFLSLGAKAQPAVLLQSPDVQVTVSEVAHEVKMLPPDIRAKVLADSRQMQNVVENIFFRKTFAREAERTGLTQNPETQYVLQNMQNRIWAESFLEQVEERALPASSVIDKAAHTTYKAEPERFTTPEETHARHILIAGQDDAARAKAEKLLAELRAGADFAALAREHSADPGSAAKGGDLGFFPKGKMVPAFEQAAFALKKPGDLSPVVPTPFGFHIIRLEGRKAATVKPFDEVKDQLRAETIAKLKNDARKKEVERVRALGQGDATALEAFIAEQKALAEKTAGKADQPPTAGKP